jgi:rSAM/selenodomain-associated transferase 1
MKKTDAETKNAEKKQDGNCVLFFVRAPEIGKVKTRLAETLGEDAALDLYMSFVADELDMFRSLLVDVIVCYYPRSAEYQVKNWLQKERYFMAQSGEDLGKRMASAFEEAFAVGYQRAVVVGSDIPDLSASVISEAFDSLTKCGVCIGPAQDGGYYLIGFRKDTFFRNIFNGVDWGTDGVLSKTLQRLQEKRTVYHLLDRWRDIDEFEDLVWLKRSLEANATVARQTLNCLKMLKERGFHSF